jgi:hypothetical protein
VYGISISKDSTHWEDFRSANRCRITDNDGMDESHGCFQNHVNLSIVLENLWICVTYVYLGNTGGLI